MNKGFTLTELLIGMGIFALILGPVTGLLVSGIRLQRQSLAEQQSLDQLSFALEYMSRALRMAKKDTTGNCLSQTGLNYENPGGQISNIKFINPLQNYRCQRFFLEAQTLKYDMGAGESPLALTAAKLQVQSLKFNLIGQSETDDLQPRVTIFLKAKPTQSARPIELQTTISQRNLDAK